MFSHFHRQILAVLPVLLICAIVYVLCTVLYRLSVDELSVHPGPLLAKISGLPNYQHAVKGDKHIWLHELHRKYGPVVRFAPNSVSFNTTSAVDSIYRSRKANVIKSDWYQAIRDAAGGFESTFTARSKARHSVKRRLLSHAFSEKALHEYEPRIASLVQQWLNCLEIEGRSGETTIDLNLWSSILIFDILGDLCFGKTFGMMTSPRDRPNIFLVPKATAAWYRIGYHPFTRLLRFLLFKTRLGPYLDGKTLKDNADFRDFCLRAVISRKKTKSEESHSDMFAHLLNGKDPVTGEGYQTGDLACESVLLMVAGTQSTSGALAATLYYLSQYPSKLAKVEREVRAAFENESSIRCDQGGILMGLSYLRATLDESMRLSPPTPGHLPREVVDKNGLHIDGYWIPPGTNVGVSAYAIHRNESHFYRSDEFLPERWTERQTHEDLLTAFQAFSAGATGCIGRQLAYMELSIALAMLIWRFDIRAETSCNEKGYEMRDAFIGEGCGPFVRLVPRTVR